MTAGELRDLLEDLPSNVVITFDHDQYGLVEVARAKYDCVSVIRSGEERRPIDRAVVLTP